MPPPPSSHDDLVVRHARYSHWDGSQAIPNLDADEILEALADDVMAEGDVASALRRLMDRGWRSTDPTRPDMPGLRDLLDRLNRQREELLDRYKLGDVLADVRAELEAIVAQEREGVEERLDRASAQRKPGDSGRPSGQTAPNRTDAADGSEAADSAADDGAPRGESAPDPSADSGEPAMDDPALRRMLREMAAKRLDQLDALPPDVGGRIRGLESYDFMEPAARDRFNALVERLRKQVLDQFVGGLSDAIKSTTPEDLAANREMVRDLNRLLQERLAGGDPDPSEFLAKHGRFFPGAQTLDDIIEQLAERMTALQSLLQSMTPEQRAELQDAMDALLRDDRLRWDLAQLAATLDQLLPGGLGERFRFGGDEPLGLDGALEQMGTLQALDALENQLDEIGDPSDLAAIDRSRSVSGTFDAAKSCDAAAVSLSARAASPCAISSSAESGPMGPTRRSMKAFTFSSRAVPFTRDETRGCSGARTM